MPSTTKQAVAEYFAAIRALDADRWVNTFAPDAVSHDPVGAPPMQGHEALHKFMSGLKDMSESLSLTEESIFVCGNSAAVKWTGKGRSHAGKDFAFEGIDVIDCNEAGKIIQVRAFWDPAPVMAALQS
jgi:steroid Delta-isomerase